MELDTRPDAIALLSATNGVFQTGGVLGTLLLPVFSDRFGRKGGLAIVSRYNPHTNDLVSYDLHLTKTLERVIMSPLGCCSSWQCEYVNVPRLPLLSWSGCIHDSCRCPGLDG